MRWLLIPAVAAGCLVSVVGCTSTPDVPGAVTFQTRVDPMVGGFCSHFAESEPSKPCLDGVEKVLAAHPEVADDGSAMIEITATVTETIASRSNSANPPQTQTVVVWVIDQVASVRKVN